MAGLQLLMRMASRSLSSHHATIFGAVEQLAGAGLAACLAVLRVDLDIARRDGPDVLQARLDDGYLGANPHEAMKCASKEDQRHGASNADSDGRTRR